MAKQTLNATRTSLYRLTRVSDLRAGIQEKYLSDTNFSVQELLVENRKCLLIVGATARKRVSWGPALSSLTGETIELENTTAAGVLIIPSAEGSSVHDAAAGGPVEKDQEVAWALTYGMGFQLLNQAKVDGGFGQRIAIRTADPQALNSLTVTTLDERARTERSSIPRGDHLRGFGVGELGELVTRLVARAEITELTAGTKPMRIRGADALSIPLAKEPGDLMRDLEVLAEILNRTPKNQDLALLEQLVLVKDEALLDELEAELGQALAKPETHMLGMGWPHERISDNGTPTSFKVFGAGRTEVEDDVPQMDDILNRLPKSSAAERLERLSRLSIMLFRDAEGTEAMSPRIPARKWLAYQADREARRYCLHDGRWYLLDQNYAEIVKKRTEDIFSRDPGLGLLPEWPEGADEEAYNKILAEALNGVCLDRDLMRSEFHRRGIETCDVLLRDGTLIHVKNIESSSPASHQLAQALVSTDALRYDPQARAVFADKIAEAGLDINQWPAFPKKVVLAMARKQKPVTAGNLFTFTQVTLVRHSAALEAQGVDVFVAPVKRKY